MRERVARTGSASCSASIVARSASSRKEERSGAVLCLPFYGYGRYGVADPAGADGGGGGDIATERVIGAPDAIVSVTVLGLPLVIS